MKKKFPLHIRPEFERIIEMLYLGVAGASLAGILAIFSSDRHGLILWYALLCLCVSLPSAIYRSVIALVARMHQVYPDPLQPLIYPFYWLSCLPLLFGYSLLIASRSTGLGIAFLVCSLGAYALLICNVKSMFQDARKEAELAAKESQKDKQTEDA
jgi:hypothetical protein